MSHFFYKRSPRIIKETSGEEVEIFSPPSLPQPPQLNIISIMVPIMVTVAGGAAMMTFYQSRGNGQFVTVQMISLCMMVVSYFVPVLVHFQSKAKHRKKIKDRERLYDNHINENRETLQNWKNELILNWHQTHLDPQFCINMVKDRSSSVWERIPQDFDFLKVRVGIGTVPSNFDITVPKQNGVEKDPMLEKAREMTEKFTTITNAPALLDLSKYRIIGLVGDEEELNMFCRTVVTQLAAHHAPDELKMAVFMNKVQRENWDWMRWIPHVWNDTRSGRYLFEERGYQPQLMEQLFTLLQRRQWLNKGEKALPFYVCFLPFIEMLEHEPILPLMMKSSEVIGVCSIVLAPSKDVLPKECELVIDLHSAEGVMRSTNVTGGSAGDATYAKPKDEVPFVQPFKSDQMTLEQADQFARQIAPYRIKRNSADEIVNVLTLFELFGIQNIEQFHVENNWQKSRYPNTLPFPVGVRGGKKPVLLNLHDKIERKGHGPHGLMAGTTGSGKSEVIQSIIASLAVEYHPHDMAFMLIDYKGGGMSNTFQELPHVIATVTNLEEEGLIERSKVSLKAELKRRQRLFIAAGNVQHIDEYYLTEWKDRDPLPHLFIVIDEFAQLKKDQPEFMSELVSIAAIGRTLGVHLLLATQKPGGVVDDKIWSNSRYKVCLRVQDESDSREMIRIPDAAHITNPGRGFLQVGSNEVFESVQFAWSGAPYRPDQSITQSDRNMYAYELDGRKTKLRDQLELLQETKPAEEKTLSKKQLNVLIEHIAMKAEREGIQRLPGPWLEPLPNHLTLEDLAVSSSEPGKILNPQVGLIDDVVNQRQFPLRIDLESGHWLIYGMPGTGKTTFIQTLLYSLAIETTPDDVNIYALDFGRMLKDYTLLPHVADVIQDDQEEKMNRLFNYLEETISKRKTLFAETGVKSRLSYCAETGNTLPAILVIIDSYVSFRGQFEKLHEKLDPLLREGPGLGIYFVATINRISDMLERIRSNFPNAVSYMLADAGDYNYAVGRLNKAPTQMPEGRAFVKGTIPPYEFQTALSINAVNESSRAKLLREQFAVIDVACTTAKPESIRVLPEVIAIPEVLKDINIVSDPTLPVHMNIDSLRMLGWDMEADGPYFIVAGRMESGKTSLLVTIGLISAMKYSPDELELYLCDFRRTPQGLGALKELNHTVAFATNEATMEEMIENLRTKLEERVADPDEFAPKMVLIMDDVDFLAKRISRTITGHLEYITRNGREHGVFIIVSGQANAINRNYDEWMKEIKSGQIGWLLGTAESTDTELFNIKVPYVSGSRVLPDGEGYYIKRKFVSVKAVHAFANGVAQVEEQVAEINRNAVLVVN